MFEIWVGLCVVDESAHGLHAIDCSPFPFFYNSHEILAFWRQNVLSRLLLHPVAQILGPFRSSKVFGAQ